MAFGCRITARSACIFNLLKGGFRGNRIVFIINPYNTRFPAVKIIYIAVFPTRLIVVLNTNKFKVTAIKACVKRIMRKAFGTCKNGNRVKIIIFFKRLIYTFRVKVQNIRILIFKYLHIRNTFICINIYMRSRHRARKKYFLYSLFYGYCFAKRNGRIYNRILHIHYFCVFTAIKA